MISQKLIEQLLSEALSRGGDFAEIFAEDTLTTEVTTLGGIAERGMVGRDGGVGIRIFFGLRSAYGYSCDTRPQALLQLVRNIAEPFSASSPEAHKSRPLIHFSGVSHPYRYAHTSKALDAKVGRLLEADRAARSVDSSITQVSIAYIDQEQKIMIANSLGRYVEDNRTRTRVLIQAVAEFAGQSQTGYTGPGALMGQEFFDTIDINAYSRDAAVSAVTMSKADPCPSGVMPVVIANGFGGLMIHEACGHSLEASFIAKDLSVFSGKLGQKIASEQVTLVDDGSIQNAWGSFGVDDEGHKAQRNVLIEKGVLKQYLVDELSGRRLGLPANGSGRRQSFRFAPTARMSNTFIERGTTTPKAIIAQTDNGLFVKQISAGSVNPVTGEFNFSVAEGYMIQNGKIGKPVKGGTLIGKGQEVLQAIDLVGNDLSLGQGYCYADSGALFISAGQPTLRISEMVVGGV